MTDKPEVKSDDLQASTDPRELFRHKQRGTVVVHTLRVLADGSAELWRRTERSGHEPASVKVGAFSGPSEASAEMQKLKRRIESDGWKEVDD